MRLIKGIVENIFAFLLKNSDFKSTEIKRIKSVLKKFKNGKTIESEEELKILKRYASTGMVRLGGFNYITRKPEARLTSQGRWFVKQL